MTLLLFFIQQEQNRINKDGYFVIKSELTRSQQLNLADAMRKLRQIIRNHIVVPVVPDPLKLEKERKSKVKAAQERVFVKRMKSMIKQDRRV